MQSERVAQWAGDVRRISARREAREEFQGQLIREIFPEVVERKIGDSEPGEGKSQGSTRTEQDRKKREEPREVSESGRSSPKR